MIIGRTSRFSRPAGTAVGAPPSHEGRCAPAWIVAIVALATFASKAVADETLVHVVRPGETLASIAEMYYGNARRESVLVAENGLTSEGGSSIVVGLRLSIPTVSYHRVQEGETWAVLASRFFGDPARAFALIEANRANAGEQPDPGAELIIPYPVRHIASQSDSLRKLAKTYYGSLKEEKTIRRFNQLKHAWVGRGQLLLMPIEDLVLSEKGKERAAAASAQAAEGGDVRAKQEEIDAELPTLRDHVRRGRYADAVAMANRLLGGGDVTAGQTVAIQRELGTALVALGRNDLAQAAFAAMLVEQPFTELDTVRTSPKVLAVFERAQAAIAEQKPEPAVDALGKKTSRAKKEEPVASPEPIRDSDVPPKAAAAKAAAAKPAAEDAAPAPPVKAKAKDRDAGK